MFRRLFDRQPSTEQSAQIEAALQQLNAILSYEISQYVHVNAVQVTYRQRKDLRQRTTYQIEVTIHHDGSLSSEIMKSALQPICEGFLRQKRTLFPILEDQRILVSVLPKSRAERETR